MTEPENKPASEEKKYWRKWYVAVLVFLLAQIAFYYFITVHFK